MESMIHLIRHAESAHNVDKDHSRLDPELTAAGIQQAKDLGRLFPFPDQVGLVITSPLRRAIDTTLQAFTNILDKKYFDSYSGRGINGGAELLLDPNFQERSSLPCDTGSDRKALEARFPHLDFSTLKPEWQLKEGLYTADQNAVDERARKARLTLKVELAALKEKEKRDIIVVTHGVFMKVLTGDPDIDLPKAGWKSYTIRSNEGASVVLEEVQEERAD